MHVYAVWLMMLYAWNGLFRFFLSPYKIEKSLYLVLLKRNFHKNLWNTTWKANTKMLEYI